MAGLSRSSAFRLPRPVPCYELRVKSRDPGRAEYQIWQLPALGTPQVTVPVQVARLRGHKLDLVEHRVLQSLAQGGVKLLGATRSRRCSYRLDEDSAVRFGLLFRCLAPMQDRDRMIAVANGIDAMEREEAAYWLGMAMHRFNPRRVLAALRLLLTESSVTGGRK